MRRTEIITGAEAADLITSGSTVAIQGSGGGVNEPSFLIKCLGERYGEHAMPKDLRLLHATGLGDRDTIGTDYLALPGLVRKDIAGHLAMAPKMAELIYKEEVEGYNLPQGVISHLYSAIASRKPGVITKVGLRTFVDPRLEGGRVNSIAKDELVKVIQLEGEEWLFYPRIDLDFALVRGSTADTLGNITMENEAAILEGISIAQAAKACGGIVIAQVKTLAEAGTLDPRLIKIPGIHVDYIVVDPRQKQHTLSEYTPSFSGEIRIPLESFEPLPLDEKKVIALRAARELMPGAVVNLGVGAPSYIAGVASEQDLLDDITFTVEQGIIGGRPAGGIIFGVSYNPEAIIGEDDQFNFYDGGGLDLAFLGMAQAGSNGDVNVSKVGPMLSGCGGFINISQNAAKVVFCGTFTVKGLKTRIGGGEIAIINEGAVRKFVNEVGQVTFSGDYARETGQQVMYVTERAVFELGSDGPVLTEIAPGIDLDRDILSLMDFEPEVREPLETMDAAFFGGRE